jgi:hypothetical protein
MYSFNQKKLLPAGWLGDAFSSPSDLSVVSAALRRFDEPEIFSECKPGFFQQIFIFILV